jgi:hypothetical protein
MIGQVGIHPMLMNIQKSKVQSDTHNRTFLYIQTASEA